MRGGIRRILGGIIGVGGWVLTDLGVGPRADMEEIVFC